tara:strand:- start:249 stop:434 length:186 start_codon:yes stop_codon:yes gene_type:complete
MEYLIGNKKIVDWGLFAEVEIDQDKSQQIEIVLPEKIQQQIYDIIESNIDKAKVIDAMAQF